MIIDVGFVSYAGAKDLDKLLAKKFHLFKKRVSATYTLETPSLPCVLCTSCSFDLRFPKCKLKISEKFYKAQQDFFHMNLRNVCCNCQICQTAKSSQLSFMVIGRKKRPGPVANLKPKSKPMKICDGCHTNVYDSYRGRGKYEKTGK